MQSDTGTTQVYDNAFTVLQQKWKMWTSYCVKDNKPLVTGLSEEVVVKATRFYLKGLQEGWQNDSKVVKYEGIVGGKL